MKVTFETLDGLTCEQEVPLALLRQHFIKRSCRPKPINANKPLNPHNPIVEIINRTYEHIGDLHYREVHP